MPTSPHDYIAIIASGVVVAIGLLAKYWFSLRRDHRDDRSGETQHKAYAGLVDRLEKALDSEITRRRAADKENDELGVGLVNAGAENSILRRKIARLESKVRDLGGSVD